MKETINKVKAILTVYQKSRDNENTLVILLYSNFYDIDKKTSLDDVFRLIDKKKLPSIQTIQRLSRKVQSENVDLRGELWEKRQRNQKKVKEDLGYNVKLKLKL